MLPLLHQSLSAFPAISHRFLFTNLVMYIVAAR